MTVTDFPEIRLDKSTVMRLETEDMARIIYQAIDDNRVYLAKWVYWVTDNYDETRNLKAVRENLDDFAAGTAYVFGVFVDGKFAGSIDIRDIKNGSAEVGYWLAEEFTGKGLATKCTQALIDFARKRHSIHHIDLVTAVDNIPSNRIAEKLGFTKVEELENTQYHVRENHYAKEF